MTTYTLLIERVAEYPECVRALVLDRDEETGLKSVMEIVETTREGGEHLIASVADVCSDGEWEFESKHADVDFGRARTKLSRIRKVVEQLP